MAVLLVHLSDSHLKTPTDPLMQRVAALSQAIAAEMDGSVTACILAFTGDATDKGRAAGFDVAGQLLQGLAADVERLTKLRPITLAVPGNHDVVLPDDTSLRDITLGSLEKEAEITRPKPAVEKEVLAPLNAYFAFVAAVAPGGSPTPDRPYYVAIDKEFDGKRLRFHLLNSSWMCNRGQEPGCLLFPVSEIRPPQGGPTPDYEITLLHHPFAWFKQPEAMRPLRDAVESISDMILTGHEHVGRLTKVVVHGAAEWEYREGEALQDGDAGEISGFHVVRLDFQQDRQTLTTYQWRRTGAGPAYVRTADPAESALGRNRRRASQPYRFRADFEAKLDDPELPVLHPKQGKLRLSDFYTYPDIKQINDAPDSPKARVRGEKVVEILAGTPRAILFGPDRCGKSSLAKRACADLHSRGDLPLLLNAQRLRNATADRLARLLETMVGEQYEALTPEAYWQVDPTKRVLIIDDLQQGPDHRNRRDELLAELERRFQRIVIVGADEFYFEELLCDETEEARKSNALWSYDLYRILPFGYVRCEQFVRNWVGLGHSKPDELEEKVAQITGLLTQFLKNNLIPQYPWVVMVIVQQADSPEPLHAENGSYGYLLQALITAALAKSRLRLPVNGKYRWLGELAKELYNRDLAALPDADARALHESYRREYGVTDIDYKEVRDDLVAAGVLRVEGNDLSFRQPYTYCYFVAWELAQRIHANDDSARREVRRLCQDLYHEDTANVLVFLAHLTTSQVVLEEMTARAAELFADAPATDFVSDVGSINSMYDKVQALILPRGDPQQNQLALKDHQDERRAELESKAKPNREVCLRRSPEDRANCDRTFAKVMEIVTAMRTIEILGQVLRNEATARKVSAMLEITGHIFHLGRRLLGFIFSLPGDHLLDKMICNLEEHYRHRMPKAKVDDLISEVSRHLFNMYTFAAFGVVKHIAAAVGERNLREVFRQLVEADPNLANRVYKLAIDLETLPTLPLRDVETLNDELTGTKRAKGRKKVAYNNLAHTLVRSLVVDYLYLNHVPRGQAQALCQKLNIEVPAAMNDVTIKRLPPGR
jgi:hypothetical protein